jgi:hypothetical protein
MSTTDERIAKHGARSLFWRITAATAVVAALATLVAQSGNVAMALGILTGGGVAIFAIAIAGRRYRRRGDVSTGTRVLAGPVDERDRRLVSRSWAITGLVVVGGLVVALLADGMGADVKEAPTVLLWVGLATLVASFLVLDHKS